MTPAASTVAGRRAAPRVAAATGAATARPVRAPRPAGPARAPRPAGPARASRPAGPARAPRRVSGPVGGRLAPQPTRRPARTTSFPRISLVRPVVAGVRALPDNSLIDRLVRGRAWIPLLGVMLAGIVASQVEILKLGSSMGRWVARNSVLSARNEQLRASVAGLADDQRIESMAAGMGMIMPAPTSLRFLTVHRGSAAAAVPHIHAPDSAQFLASLPAVNTPASATQTSSTASNAPPGSTSAGSTTTSTPATGANSTGATATQTTSTAAQSAGSSQSSVGASQGTAAAAQASQGPAGGGPSPSTASSGSTTGATVSGGGAGLAPAGPSGQSSGG